MANIKSSAKRAEIAKVRNSRNKIVKTGVKTAVKNFEQAVISDDKELAMDNYRKAVIKIDCATTKGLYHKNTAARKKSVMARKLNAM